MAMPKAGIRTTSTPPTTNPATARATFTAVISLERGVDDDGRDVEQAVAQDAREEPRRHCRHRVVTVAGEAGVGEGEPQREGDDEGGHDQVHPDDRAERGA